MVAFPPNSFEPLGLLFRYPKVKPDGPIARAFRNDGILGDPLGHRRTTIAPNALNTGTIDRIDRREATDLLRGKPLRWSQPLANRDDLHGFLVHINWIELFWPLV